MPATARLLVYDYPEVTARHQFLQVLRKLLPTKSGDNLFRPSMETTLLIQRILFQAYENVYIWTTPEFPSPSQMPNLWIVQGRNYLPSYALQAAEHNDGTKYIKQGQ